MSKLTIVLFTLMSTSIAVMAFMPTEFEIEVQAPDPVEYNVISITPSDPSEHVIYLDELETKKSEVEDLEIEEPKADNGQSASTELSITILPAD